MKKTIKLLTLLFFITSMSFVLFDEYIIHKMIVSTAEKITNKKTELNDLNIYYLPDLTLELIGLKLPNPVEDNHLLISDNLTISMDVNELLKKRLIISKIFSQNTVFFDASNPPKKLPSFANKKSVKARFKRFDFMAALIEKQTSSLALGDISTTVASSLSFDKEYNEIDDVISQSGQVFLTRKEQGLSLSNDILYEINQINPEKVTSINDIVSLQEKLPKIDKKINELDINTSTLKIIYDQSLLKINELNATINQKIDDSFSFNINSGDNNISSKNVDVAIRLFSSFMNSFKKSPVINYPASTVTGTTYHFNDQNNPNILIKNIDINNPNSDDYLMARNITFVKHPASRMSILFTQKNKPNYKNLSIEYNTIQDGASSIKLNLNEIRIPTYRIFENDKLQVNMVELSTTELFASANITDQLDMRGSFYLKSPNFRVINKQPNSHPIGSVIPYLNNKTIKFFIAMNGPLDNPNTVINTNLDTLVGDIKSQILDKKIQQFKNKRDRKATELKAQQSKKLDAKRSQLNDSFSQTEVALKFQVNELKDKLESLDRSLKQKKVYIENSVKSSVENQIKKIKIN
ncbi:MAG: hypothetical protein ACON35_08795 [Candidatus Marinamargulisbacteria bacterium]